MAAKRRSERTSQAKKSERKNEPVEDVAVSESADQNESVQEEQQEIEDQEEQADYDLPSSEEEDEEDEEEEEDEEVDFADDSAATGATTDIKGGHSITKSVSTKTAKAEKATARGVIYIGRLPKGFEEVELKKYFSQFGDITRLRLSRNKKTGNSKHFAFIEFSNAKVAEIAVETMDNYLLMGHQLKCSVIAPENVHPTLFKGSNHRFKPANWTRVAMLKSQAPKTKAQWEELQQSHNARKTAKQDKLKAMGIDYSL